MGALQAIYTILPLAFTAGINLYLTVLVIGLSIRFGWVEHTPPGMDILASLPVLIAAGALYILEFFADKISFVDTIWDVIHTFIRPAGSMALTVVSLAGLDIAPQAEVITALVAGAVALTSHSGKAGTRTAVNVASPLENITNILVSLGEDVLVALLAFLALRYPTAANVVTIILLIVLVAFLPPLLRWIWFILQAIFARLKALVSQHQQSDALPPEHALLLGNQAPEISIACQAQNIRKAQRRYGYLSLHNGDLFFTYHRWFRAHCWYVLTQQITHAHVLRHMLLVTIEITYHDEQQVPGLARFTCTYDRARLAEQLTQRWTRATTDHARV